MKTFHFQFHVKTLCPKVDSFKTAFWLEEKGWYVSSQSYYVFSAPYFSPKPVEIESWSRSCLAYDIQDVPQTSLCSMNITSVPTDNLPYFTHIRDLSIDCEISFPMLRSFVNLKQIKYLSVLSITNLLIFQPYDFAIPNLYELSIKNYVTFDGIEQFKGCQFKQIRKLRFSISEDDTNYTLNGLFYCFPHIEFLQYLSQVASAKQLIYVIDGFPYLLNVYFAHSLNLLCGQREPLDSYSNLSMIAEKSKRLCKNSFACGVEELSSEPFDTHWWFAPQVSF